MGSRVLHVLVPAPVGGLERVVQMLAIAQRRAGSDVGVAAIVGPGQADHPFFEPLETESVPCYRLEVGPKGYATERRVVREAIRRARAEVVHTHGYRPDVLAGAVAGGLGLGVVSTAHGFTGGPWKNRFYERLQIRAYRRRGHIVAVSRPLRAHLLACGVPERRLHVIRNAWLGGEAPLSRTDARARLGLSPNIFVAGWIGRVGEEKGADLAVRALAGMPAAHLSIIGEGAARPGIERLVRDLDLEDRVHWHGRVQDAARVLPAFDAFLLSSRTEGTPIVVLEALAAGVPIVATEVGGVPDMIRHEVEALLVRPEDPTALLAALRRIREDARAAAVRATAGQARLRDAFGVDAWHREYGRVYEIAARAALDDGGSEGRRRPRGLIRRATRS